MKRTILAIASLTAILLLSCGSLENPNSSSEDLNFSQKPTLQKGFPDFQIYGMQTIEKFALLDDEIQGSSNPGQTITPYATGSKTVDCPGTMHLQNVPYGQYGLSDEVTCDFTSLPNGSKNTKYEFITYSMLGDYTIGALGDNRFVLECGDYYTVIPTGSLGPITTTVFVGDPAKVKCKLSFIAKCVLTGLNGAPCREYRHKVKMTSYYTY